MWLAEDYTEQQILRIRQIPVKYCPDPDLLTESFSGDREIWDCDKLFPLSNKEFDELYDLCMENRLNDERNYGNVKYWFQEELMDSGRYHGDLDNVDDGRSEYMHKSFAIYLAEYNAKLMQEYRDHMRIDIAQ